LISSSIRYPFSLSDLTPSGILGLPYPATVSPPSVGTPVHRSYCPKSSCIGCSNCRFCAFFYGRTLFWFSIPPLKPENSPFTIFCFLLAPPPANILKLLLAQTCPYKQSASIGPSSPTLLRKHPPSGLKDVLLPPIPFTFSPPLLFSSFLPCTSNPRSWNRSR